MVGADSPGLRVLVAVGVLLFGSVDPCCWRALRRAAMSQKYFLSKGGEGCVIILPPLPVYANSQGEMLVEGADGK